MRKNSGQALIIILLILVVVLTVGLAVVGRTVTDIKLSGQTELSSRAFSAAEAGVESVLSGAGSQTNVAVGENANYTVTVSNVGGTNAPFVWQKPIAKDDTQQVWFIGHKKDGTLGCGNDSDGTPLNCFASRYLTVFWGNPGQSPNQLSGSSITPALEITVVYKDAVGFKMAKGIYDPSASRASTNHFLTGVDTSGGFTSSRLQFKKDLDLAGSPFNISGMGTGTTLYAVRLRLLYNDVSQLLGAGPTNSSDTLPVQGKLISSTGSSGEVSRKVEVFESYPYLPGIFDYVLFNGGAGSLSK